MRIILFSLILLSAIVSTSPAQWAWVKAVGVSGSTDWDAVSMDETGNFYFSGYSDKLAGTPPRAYVTAKYDQAGTALWNTKLKTASNVTGSSNGVDAAGNSYMIQGVLGGQKVTLPDGSDFSHFLTYHFVSKYNADGSLAWAKKLTIPSYSRFQVLPDGTVGILATNVIYYYLFGADSIPGGGDYFIEIKSDGTLGRSVQTGEIGTFTPTYLEWKEPGKLFAINSLSIYTSMFQRATIDLAAKTLTYEGDTLIIGGQLGALFLWNNTGIANSPTTVLEPKSGHVFALMSCNTGDCYLNQTDTLHFKTNNQTNEGYVVELDESMKVVRKVRLTNPVQLAVRDSLVVVTAIVRATDGFGFQSPDTTIKITKTSNNQDGYVVYVMDRNFQYLRHGLIESQIQRLFTPFATLIGPHGEVIVSLSADGDLYFQGMAPFTGHSGTVLAKLNGGGSSSVEETQMGDQLAVYPNPISREFTIEQPGAFRYTVIDILGNRVASGSGTDKIQCDIGDGMDGSYFVVIETNNNRIVRMLKKIQK